MVVFIFVDGYGYVLVFIVMYDFDLVVYIDGIDDVIVVYIYIGCVGNNGDVLVVFE